MPKNNLTGKNGTDNGTWPPDHELKETLHQCAREQLPLAQRIERLVDTHQLYIGKTKLKQLNKKFDVPSVRRAPMHKDVAAQYVLQKMDSDRNKGNGANAVKDLLAREGVMIPRGLVRKVLHDNDFEGLDACYPGQKKPIRTQLTSFGTFAEVNCDGHAKGDALALQMGPVSLPLYGMRDKWSGTILHLVVVPNDRLASTIGHVYLDFIQVYKAIPIQITVDKGSETGEMFAMQKAFRTNFTPDLCQDKFPPLVALKSTKNTPIEGLWHWLRKTEERNFLDEVKRGHNEGIFHAANPLHADLFFWLWPPIRQQGLNDFVEYWNGHRIRKQAGKLMPSGATPRDIFTSPAKYGGEKCAIAVPEDAIKAMRDRLPVTREEAFQFVNPEFAAKAEEIWNEVGRPARTLKNAWQIFEMMLPHFQD